MDCRQGVMPLTGGMPQRRSGALAHRANIARRPPPILRPRHSLPTEGQISRTFAPAAARYTICPQTILPRQRACVCGCCEPRANVQTPRATHYTPHTMPLPLLVAVCLKTPNDDTRGVTCCIAEAEDHMKDHAASVGLVRD